MRDLAWRQARAYGYMNPPSPPLDWAAAQMAYDSKIVDPVQPPYVDQYINGYQTGLKDRRKLNRIIYEQGKAEGRRDAVAWMIFGLFMAGLLWTMVRYLLIAG